MLQKNDPLVQKGDANWTFGQTLALLLLLVPLRDIAETLLERRPKRLGRKLLEAAGEGKLDIVQYVYGLGADSKMKGERFTGQEKERKLTLLLSDLSLLAAVKGGHLDVVEFLLEKRADVNVKGKVL